MPPILQSSPDLVAAVRDIIQRFNRPVHDVADHNGQIAGYNAAPAVENGQVVVYEQLEGGLQSTLNLSNSYTDSKVQPVATALADEVSFARQQETGLRNDLAKEIADRAAALAAEALRANQALAASEARVENDIILAMQRTIWKPAVAAVIDVPIGNTVVLGQPVTLSSGLTYTPRIGDTILRVAQGGNTVTPDPTNGPFVIGADGGLTLDANFNAPEDRLTGSIFPQLLMDAAGLPYLGEAWRCVTPGPVSLPDGQRGIPIGTPLVFAQNKQQIVSGDRSTFAVSSSGVGSVLLDKAYIDAGPNGLRIAPTEEASLRDLTKTTGLLPSNRLGPITTEPALTSPVSMAVLIQAFQNVVMPKMVVTYAVQPIAANNWDVPHGIDLAKASDPDTWIISAYDSTGREIGNPVQQPQVKTSDPTRVTLVSSVPVAGRIKIVYLTGGSVKVPALTGGRATLSLPAGSTVASYSRNTIVTITLEGFDVGSVHKVMWRNATSGQTPPYGTTEAFTITGDPQVYTIDTHELASSINANAGDFAEIWVDDVVSNRVQMAD